MISRTDLKGGRMKALRQIYELIEFSIGWARLNDFDQNYVPVVFDFSLK